MPLNVLGNDGALEFDVRFDSKTLAASISKLEADLQRLTNTANSQTKSIESFASKAALAMGSYLSLTAVEGFISKMVRVRAEFQSLEISFATMLGSKEKGEKLLQEVGNFAASTPFDLQETAKAAKSLLAFGVASDDVVSTLRRLGDVSSGINAPIGEIAEIYGKARVQGRLFQEDINQLTGRGIPIIQELAKQFNVAEGEVKALTEAGKIGFAQVEQAFISMTSKGSMFGGLMEKQSKSINGSLSNLSDSVDKMFNEIGRSQEGLIGGSIGVISSLVENYQKVIDIVKVLAITYGTYRAALMLTQVASTVLGTTTKSLTALQILQAGATGIANKTMALLNKTMLANPAVLVATAIGTLVAAMIVFKDETIEVKNAQDLLADAQKSVGNALAETKSKILPYLEALKNANLSENERVNIYKKLQEIDPKIVAGLDAKTLSYEKLKNNVDLYLNSLRNQLKLEANEGAAKESIKQEQEFERVIEERTKKLEKLQQQQQKASSSGYNPYGGSSAGVAVALEIQQVKAQITSYDSLLKQQQKVTEKFGKAAAPPPPPPEVKAAVVRNEAYLKAEIKRIQELREPLAVASKEYKLYTAQIEKLQAELNPQKALKSAQAEEKKHNAALQDKVTLLEELKRLHSESQATGLSKEASEIDNINRKYDEAIKKITEYNSKHPNAQLTKAEVSSAMSGIDKDRNFEIFNAIGKQDAESFKKQLDTQKEVFEQYEEAKKQIGLKKANELFAGQIAGFDSYLSFLKSQQNDLVIQEFVEGASVGLEDEFKAVNERIVAEGNRLSKQSADKAVSDYKRLIEVTKTYNEQVAAINKQYEDDTITANKNFQGEELTTKLAILRSLKDQELKELADNHEKQSRLYQALNEDIVNKTKEQLRERKVLLQQFLAEGKITEKDGSITIINGQGIADIKKAIVETDKLLDNSKQIAEYFEATASSLHQLGDAVSGLSSELGSMLNQMGDYAKIGGDIVRGMAGDPTAIISAASGILKLFSDARQSRLSAAKDVQDFQAKIIASELETTLQYRERERTQIRINELKIDGLKKEQELLDQQKKKNASDYKSIFAQLQKESFISGKDSEKEGFNPLFGLVGLFTRKTKVTDQLSSLSGKTFEDLEKLFNSGQLTENANRLFTQLQKLKQEGADIDALIESAKEEAKKIFTGTTSDSILDNIVKGFSDGKRAAADFADNFEELMKQSILNSFKYQALEKPIKDFYEQFAAAAESDNVLTQAELDNLSRIYNTTIENAALQFEQLQKLTNINLNPTSGSVNTLTGAIKGITAEQATLLAGQFGGLRITAFNQLQVAQSSLRSLQSIDNNTASTAQTLASYFRKWDTTGLLLK